MKSLDYLQDYYQFDSDIVAAVTETAEWQDRRTYEELAKAYEVEESLLTVYSPHSHKPVDILILRPQGDYDESASRVYHLPMANILDENQVMNGMRLFGSDPTQPLVLAGNPGPPGHGHGKVSWRDAAYTWQKMDLAPYVEPLLEYLYNNQVTNVTHLGYSYGADKALSATLQADKYDQCVPGAVYAEPVSVVSRGMLRLAAAFGRTNSKLKSYIAQAESEPYQAVRDQENLGGLLGYSLGLLRVSNLAIGSVLAHESFEGCAGRALHEQPTAMTVAWGTASELAPDSVLQDIVARLQVEYGDRVQPLRLKNMHHAGANDINLHAALMLQGLRNLPEAGSEAS